MGVENIIAFQGVPGAYGELAAKMAQPAAQRLACPDFEGVVEAVSSGAAALGILPIENSIAGRVADIHPLLLRSDLYLVGEHFQPIQHCLLGVYGTKFEHITHVHSHAQGLSQSRQHLRQWGFKPVIAQNTAMAAKFVAEQGDVTQGAIASELAAELYGLQILRTDCADQAHNTTRFVLISKAPLAVDRAVACLTSLSFQVRSIPAALYKALGGFATNGINLVKLESFIVPDKNSGEHFVAADFYAEFEGHPDQPAAKQALDELQYFAKQVRILGSYPKADFRQDNI